MKIDSVSSLSRLSDVLVVMFAAAENGKRMVLVLLSEGPLPWLIPVLNLLAGHVVWIRRENIHAELLCRNLKEMNTERKHSCRIVMSKPERRRHFGRRWPRGKDNIKMDLERKVRRVWTGVIFLTTETSAKILRMRLFAFSFHKMRKCGELHGYLKKLQLLKKEPAVWRSLLKSAQK